MGERIYIMSEENEKRQLEPLMEESFKKEDDLQKLIAEYPELIAGEQINPSDPRRWILIKREQGIPETVDAGNRWAVDLLMIDQDAIPTLVEVKRGKNPEIRRTIVGQMLEYAAHARHTWKVEELRQKFETTNPNQGRDALRKLLAFEGDEEDEPDADAFWENVATNLAASRLRLLFVADEIPDPLAQVVRFLSEKMPSIGVMAVEIKQFKGESSQTLVPRVIGRTSSQTKGSASGYKATRENILELFEQSAPKAHDAAKRLINMADEHRAKFGSGENGISIRGRYSIKGKTEVVSVAWLYPEPDKRGLHGTKNFTFGMLNRGKFPEVQSLLREWTNQFEQDEFATPISNDGVTAYAVDHSAVVQNIDLLAIRLEKVLLDLKALSANHD